MRNAGLVAALVVTGCTARDAASPAPTTTVPPAPRQAIEITADHRGLDDTLLVGQPVGGQTVLYTLDLPFGIADRRVVDGDGGLVVSGLDATSPDGRHAASFADAALHLDERSFPMKGVGHVVGGLAWSPDSEAVYFLAGSGDGSADRIIGLAVGGSPQTVATFHQRGFYGLAVTQDLTS